MDTSGRRQIGVKVRRKTKEKSKYLPDDIIPNILCRLPAKNVMQCRLVCKGWRDLTLTPDFVDLHFRHNSHIPMILVADRKARNRTVDYFLLDKWWELPVRRKLMIHKFSVDSDNISYNCYPQFSHAGLVVFRNNNSGDVIVGNPMDPKNVTKITLSKEIRWSEICGVFYHPSLKEYYSLWMIQNSNEHYLDSWNHPNWIKYKMLTLNSIPSMKTISNPFSHRVKRSCSKPLFINKYFYWMVEAEYDKYKNIRSDIMQFDIISEEFMVIPCPMPLDYTRISFLNTKLLNIDGTLSFLLILPRQIIIWRLEDHAQQLWTTSTYTFSIRLYPDIDVPEPIAVVEGKLAVLTDGRLVVYNLMQGTMYCRKTQYCNVIFRSHQMSLASLTNCTSKIFIDQEGEVARKVSKG